MKGKYLPLAVALILIGGGVGLRLLPHPANFAPITAIAIFGGAVLPRRLGVWVPLAAMMISDLVIGFYDVMPVTWLCFALIAAGSSYWLQKRTLMRGVAMTLAASLFFFVVTNFAVWVGSGMYPHGWAGLVDCYAMALPFFRATLASDLMYTAGLFGLYAAASRLVGYNFVAEPSI
jgi:hypothetical protein